MLKDPRDKLAMVHPELAAAVKSAVEQLDFDVLVVCGYRGKIDQEAAFKSGNSKARFGSSPHNLFLSCAVDLCPLDSSGKPDWKTVLLYDKIKVAMLAAGNITAGADFKKLVDRPHFELTDWKQRLKAGEVCLK
jgi:peptidoglycan L-alanyl-D-glutamate endopeptidase CwlK